MAVAAGLGVMTALMEESVTAVAGPKGKHQPGRRAVRHGSEDGSVTLGGRRVPVRRPRVRAVDGSGELPVQAYELFSSTDLLGAMAMERMLAKLSCRRYQVGLEPVGAEVSARAWSTSKSAVSRRFVKATETALGELLARDLSGLDLVGLMVDGVHFGDHLCVVALGIGIDGVKRPLAVVEGATENTTTVTDLLVGLRDRGLDVTRPILFVIDGAKALCSAVEVVFDCPVVARCQLHKIRNVQAKLPDQVAATVSTKTPSTTQTRRSQPSPGTATQDNDRVHDRDLPGPLHQRQALAGRDHGPALVRSRHGRGRQAVPQGQRTPPPPRPARRPRRRSRRPAPNRCSYRCQATRRRLAFGASSPCTTTTSHVM